MKLPIVTKNYRAIAASIARLVIYVQLIKAAIAMEAVDQNRKLIFCVINQSRLTLLDRSAHLVHVLEHTRSWSSSYRSLLTVSELSRDDYFNPIRGQERA